MFLDLSATLIVQANDPIGRNEYHFDLRHGTSGKDASGTTTDPAGLVR